MLSEGENVSKSLRNAADHGDTSEPRFVVLPGIG